MGGKKEVSDLYLCWISRSLINVGCPEIIQPCIWKIRFERCNTLKTAAAMGKTSSQQFTLVQFFGKTSNHPSDSAPIQPRFDTLQLLAFPNAKITLEREEISDLSMRLRKIWWRSLWRLVLAAFWAVGEMLGELCEVPSCLLWRGLRRHYPMYTVSCIMFNKCLCFSHYMVGYFPDRPSTFEKIDWKLVSNKSDYIYSFGALVIFLTSLCYESLMNHVKHAYMKNVQSEARQACLEYHDMENNSSRMKEILDWAT